ncbi:MAG: hypothetical protein A2822_04875 [Candidatus Staskawiczbacteria bacterium RIFCSPHIGHO2_01_FULL_41_41]|uniref:Uncharacterized protein n=1 Tax=Candidatus Staskawiczbacteria bacterium RIFCSPHIGHO2_01_FULL_41_41 TaxID=1802203 RepID=A0A1G2HUE5_9BACT|nr:MAG: hypothetical protein A2822_04875 [Candidatus Staskawiczbacteria bacterium RIFCSPHIGHO2_01_FULL_41_41]OGZ74404.1 MAG: hypothetical protein A3A12_01380 [Candidatus Staskawiczbacteria bacterium RIFCSPLOWO2_01_FULL_43_17b]
MEYSRKSSLLWILVYLTIGVIACAALYYFFPYKNVPDDGNSQIPITNPQNETADWKTYRNDEYGFEVKYPVIFSRGNTASRLLDVQNAQGLRIRCSFSMYTPEEMTRTWDSAKSFIENENNHVFHNTPNTHEVWYKANKIQVNGISAYQEQSLSCYMGGCGESNNLLAPLGGGSLVCGLMKSEESVSTEREEEIRKNSLFSDQESALAGEIFSTFKFTK